MAKSRSFINMLILSNRGSFLFFRKKMLQDHGIFSYKIKQALIA